MVPRRELGSKICTQLFLYCLIAGSFTLATECLRVAKSFSRRTVSLHKKQTPLKIPKPVATRFAQSKSRYRLPTPHGRTHDITFAERMNADVLRFFLCRSDGVKVPFVCTHACCEVAAALCPTKASFG
ncbi:hypothetical protein TRVL_04129 [Trypanosoma vivax]|nr:hypothetical protein TRVL_04129 [Trypanosoma vivax]